MATTIHPTAIIYPNVTIQDGSSVGPYALIGVPPRGSKPGELPTVVGPGAIIRSHTVIYAGTSIGAHFQSGHGAMIREYNRIGDEVSIGSHSVIEHHIVLGDRVRIHSGAFIPEYSLLEEQVWVGPNVVFTNALHPRCPKAKQCLQGPRVRYGAKIGANSTLLPDIEIGELTLVGAGSVVVSDLPPHIVVAGNPAKPIKSISDLKCPYGLIDSPYSEDLSKVKRG